MHPKHQTEYYWNATTKKAQWSPPAKTKPKDCPLSPPGPPPSTPATVQRPSVPKFAGFDSGSDSAESKKKKGSDVQLSFPSSKALKDGLKQYIYDSILVTMYARGVRYTIGKVRNVDFGDDNSCSLLTFFWLARLCKKLPCLTLSASGPPTPGSQVTSR